MNELGRIGRRLADVAHDVIIGTPTTPRGISMSSDAPDPRDEEIAALKQQLADAEAAKSTPPPADTSADTPQPAAPATVDGDEIIAEAKQRLEAGEGLDAVHVRAIEHPEEFAGQQVQAPDTNTP